MADGAVWGGYSFPLGQRSRGSRRGSHTCQTRGSRCRLLLLAARHALSPIGHFPAPALPTEKLQSLEARRPNHRTCTLPRSRTVADWPMAASSRSPFLLAACMHMLQRRPISRFYLLFVSLSSIVAGKLGWHAFVGCMWPAYICIYCPVRMSTLYLESLSSSGCAPRVLQLLL